MAWGFYSTPNRVASESAVHACNPHLGVANALRAPLLQTLPHGVRKKEAGAFDILITVRSLEHPKLWP